MQNYKENGENQPHKEDDDGMTGNPYDAHFSEVSERRKRRAENQRASTSYQHQPWHIRQKPMFLFAIGTSVACHLITAVASASNVFTFLNNLLSGVAVAMVLAIVGTLVFLGAIEWLKRWLLAGFWRDYHDPNNLSLERVFQISRISFLLLIFTLDMALSWSGSVDFARVVKEAPVAESPTLLDREAEAARFQAEIKQAEKSAADYFAARQWKHKLDIKDGKQYAKMRGEVSALIARRDAAVARADSINATLTNKADSDYLLALELHNASIQSQGHILAWVSMGSFAALVLCIFFIEKYEYRLWFYNRYQKGRINGSVAAEQALKGEPVTTADFEEPGKS